MRWIDALLTALLAAASVIEFTLGNSQLAIYLALWIIVLRMPTR